MYVYMCVSVCTYVENMMKPYYNTINYIVIHIYIFRPKMKQQFYYVNFPEFTLILISFSLYNTPNVYTFKVNKNFSSLHLLGIMDITR